MKIGQTARRTRTVTAEGEILEVRADKPICTMRTTITNQDATVVLDGTALVYRAPLDC